MLKMPKQMVAGFLLLAIFTMKPVNLFADATQFIERASVAYGEGRMDDAILLLGKALDGKGLDRATLAGAYGNRCVAKMSRFLDKNNKMDLDGALFDCNRATELMPDDHLGYVYRAQILQLRGDIKRALENYNVAVKLAPDQWTVRFERARLLLELNQPQKAISDYTQILSEKSSYLPALIGRGLAFIKDNKQKAALKDFNSAVNLDPNNNELLLERCNILVYLNHHEDALKDYNTLIKRIPGEFRLYSGRGVVFIQLGNMDAALDDFLAAKRLGGGKDSVLYSNLGMIYFFKGDYIKANENFKLAVNLNPSHLFAQLWLMVSSRLADQSEPVLPNQPSNSNWPDPLLQFFKGKIASEDILAKAKKLADTVDNQGVVYETFFFLGLYYLSLEEDKKAKNYLEKAIEGIDDKEILGKIARIKQQKLVGATKGQQKIVVANTSKPKTKNCSTLVDVVRKGFAISIGSFRSLALAKEHCNNVEKLGLPIYMYQADVNKTNYFRLRSGPFTSKVEALQAKELIMKQTGLTPKELFAMEAGNK
ncbi:MAG: tetratricopeptide repeat protein [Magnetococcales bacterium]|nr:tetratricopeptide repeat protein [Magnetococcales bacterium]